MMTPKKLSDPSWPFLQSMMSLYLNEKVTPHSGRDAVETLPPMEALVLGVMCLTKTYNSRYFVSVSPVPSRRCEGLLPE